MHSSVIDSILCFSAFRIDMPFFARWTKNNKQPKTRPPTAVTGVGLAPNSYKIDGESQIGVGRGFPADPPPPRPSSLCRPSPLATFAIPSIKEEERVARKNRGSENERSGRTRRSRRREATRRGLETRVTQLGRERERERKLHTSAAARTQAPGTRGDTRRRRCIGSCTPATPGTSHVVGLPSTAIHGGQLLLLRLQVVHLRLRSSRSSSVLASAVAGCPGIPSSPRIRRTNYHRHVTSVPVGTRDPGQGFRSKETSKRRESSVTQAVSAVKPGGSTVASGALVSQLAFDCDCVYTVPCIGGGGSARTHRRTRIHNIADLLSNLLLVPAKAHPPISGVEGEVVFEKGTSASYEESNNRILELGTPRSNDRAPTTPRNADEEGEDGNTVRVRNSETPKLRRENVPTRRIRNWVSSEKGKRKCRKDD
ncbi:hypothetical protein G5I_12350 [Acromyrmex echinatior]|uniref:Uncharacterized protein n=1 Tax=Acromyrmex echinatior TaxID=103372 RepID=F4X229_ACREC|nr:hypothetical protein G5I_12350 [Acromyrmex echinatior]